MSAFDGCGLRFVMNAYAVYGSSLRIVSGCEKVMWKRGSLTMIDELTRPRSGTSACP